MSPTRPKVTPKSLSSKKKLPDPLKGCDENYIVHVSKHYFQLLLDGRQPDVQAVLIGGFLYVPREEL